MKPLTARQEQIVRMVCDNLGHKQIAYQLGISESTLKNTLKVIYTKLGIDSQIPLVRWAIRTGLILP